MSVDTGPAAAVQAREAAIAERGRRLRRRNLHLEGIVDEDDSVWLSFLSRGLAAARSVGRVVVLAGGGNPVRPAGTGVLVAPALLLTNNHVIWDGERAAAMGVELGYDYDDNGAELPFHTCRLDEDLRRRTRLWTTAGSPLGLEAIQRNLLSRGRATPASSGGPATTSTTWSPSVTPCARPGVVLELPSSSRPWSAACSASP